MKLMIASDIHGSAGSCRKMLDQFEKEGAQRLLLLGDLLYHGPRNDLPEDYRPKEVISLLNGKKQSLLCVRGNCEAEVDQMVLQFPILADYALLALNGVTFYATHGHVYNQDHIPPMQNGDVLVHGHTHLLKAERTQASDGERTVEITVLNPGSTSIPKGGNPPTYAILDGREFTILTFEDETVAGITL